MPAYSCGRDYGALHLDAMTLRWRPALEGSVAKLEARLEKEFRAQLQALTISSQLTSPRDRSIQARQQ